MQYGVVYRITNLETGKCYIGRTKRPLYERWYGHCYRSSTCDYLKRAIQKYGKESFSINAIASSWDAESLKELEMLLIQQENTLAPDGYNLINNGTGVTSISEITREKLSLAHRGRVLSSEIRQKMSDASRGKPKSEEHRLTMSLTRKGRPSKMKGKQFSEAARQNMGGQNRGKIASQETRDKMSAVRKGSRWYTDGTRDLRFHEGASIPEGFVLGRSRGLTNIPEIGHRGFKKNLQVA